MDPDFALEFVQSPEQYTLYRAACLNCESMYPPMKFKIWGCIHGVQNDYLVIQSSVYHPFNRPMTFYSRDGISWTQLPEVSQALLTKKPFFAGLFNGDPTIPVAYSDFIVNGVVINEAINEVKEEDRLAYFINEVDSEGFMLPKGSYELSDTGYIRPKPSYNGMMHEDLRNLKSYYTFTQLDRTKLFNGEGDYRNQEALRPLLEVIPDHATPRGRWNIRDQPWGNYVIMKNIRFPGLNFAIAINSPSFGRFYNGEGLKEIHEPFVHGSPYDEELLIDVGFTPDYDYKLPPELRPQPNSDSEPLALITPNDKTYTSEIAASMIREMDEAAEISENESSDVQSSNAPSTSASVIDVTEGETSGNETE